MLAQAFLHLITTGPIHTRDPEKELELASENILNVISPSSIISVYMSFGKCTAVDIDAC